MKKPDHAMPAPTAAELIQSLHRAAEMADMAYVIVAGTALEDFVELALTSRMRELSKSRNDRLFGAYGPLSTFSAKIDVAYALEIIDDDLLADFNAIRSIRNTFAHPQGVVHFGSPELKPELQKLSGWTCSADPRALFDERMNACIEALIKRIDAAILADALRNYSASRRADQH
jgi:DNA-binding MltR family transcriptional regulator